MENSLTAELSQIEHTVQTHELLQDFDAIQMARSPEVLRRFVVGTQAIDHPAQGWAQTVLELQIKYDDIRRARINAELIQLEIGELESQGTEKSRLEAKLKCIDIEAQNRAMLGAVREFKSLYAIYKGFEKRYTREELDATQIEYWQNRLTRQAMQDQQSNLLGISAGNLQALREANVSPTALPNVEQSLRLPTGFNIDDVVKTEARFLGTASATVRDVETRYLETGKQRMLIVTLTASAERPTQVPALDRPYRIPTTVEQRFHCIHGMTIDAGYTEAVFQALRDGATHLMCIEDDTFPPLDAIERLLVHDKDIVCGWYPKRQEGPRIGVPIILKNGKRQSLDTPDDSLVELYTAPMGCTLIKMDVFRRIEMPWFVTTGQLTQDSFFSQKARDAGYTLWCDTSIRCEHIDRITNKIYV